MLKQVDSDCDSERTPKSNFTKVTAAKALIKTKDARDCDKNPTQGCVPSLGITGDASRASRPVMRAQSVVNVAGLDCAAKLEMCRLIYFLA